MNKDDLIAFEKEIAESFERGEIAAPVHLSGGNEDQLIKIFERVAADDWVFCTWRAHYHCLLKGVPPEKLKQKIVAGRSINLCFPEHKILCSALVGGVSPIALGVAWAIKQASLPLKAWCFIGDMGARCGIVHEVLNYARGHNLPLVFVVEDNKQSVMTDTEQVWGHPPRGDQELFRYEYKLMWPHVGTGHFVEF